MSELRRALPVTTTGSKTGLVSCVIVDSEAANDTLTCMDGLVLQHFVHCRTDAFAFFTVTVIKLR